MDELIKRLRNSCRDCKLWDGNDCCLDGDCERRVKLQAADAIEQLSADLERSIDWSGFWQEEANRAKEKIQQYALAVANKPHWIPVTERLPQDTQVCIVVSKIGEMGFAVYKDEQFVYPYYMGKATHWMPLPQPPKEET